MEEKQKKNLEGKIGELKRKITQTGLNGKEMNDLFRDYVKMQQQYQEEYGQIYYGN